VLKIELFEFMKKRKQHRYPSASSTISKSSALLHRHILKPVSTLPCSLRPRKTNFSLHRLHLIVTFSRCDNGILSFIPIIPIPQYRRIG